MSVIAKYKVKYFTSPFGVNNPIIIAGNPNRFLYHRLSKPLNVG